MTWINNIFEFIGFDISDNWAFIPQLLTLVPLAFFTFKSIRVFYKESVSEHNQQGAIPILAVVYSIISVMYCYIFTKNFGTVIGITHYKILNILDYNDNQKYYIFTIKLLTSTALLAFTFNFYKSLYTLNSLEFGVLNKKPLKSIFEKSNKKAIIEAILRFLIACIFIYLEKKLGTTNYNAQKPINNDAFNFSDPTFIYYLGLIISGLYFALFLWVLIFHKGLDKKKEIPIRWYKYTYIQFISGFVVGLLFVFVGSNYTSEYKELLLLIFSFGVIASLVLIASIIINEYYSHTNGQLQSAH
jgi:hypothetical protein